MTVDGRSLRSPGWFLKAPADDCRRCRIETVRRRIAQTRLGRCEDRAAALAYVAVEPVMEFLRVDPECRPVLERAGLLMPVR